METIKANILQTLTLDDEVASNQGNEYTIIEYIRNAIQTC